MLLKESSVYYLGFIQENDCWRKYGTDNSMLLTTLFSLISPTEICSRTWIISFVMIFLNYLLIWFIWCTLFFSVSCSQKKMNVIKTRHELNHSSFYPESLFSYSYNLSNKENHRWKLPSSMFYQWKIIQETDTSQFLNVYRLLMELVIWMYC
jgi:hypothetical protein